MRVQVYFNLHKKCWSVRDKKTGRVITHTDHITLRDCKFTVQPSGRERVLREKKKNVHAWIEGEITPLDTKSRDGWATYNPYKHETFMFNNETPIVAAEKVYMHAIYGKPSVWVWGANRVN